MSRVHALAVSLLVTASAAAHHDLQARQAALVVPGAKAVITAQVKDGKPTALRMPVGRNGFTPPM